MKYLDLTGLQKFWAKIKNHVQNSLKGYVKNLGGDSGDVTIAGANYVSLETYEGQGSSYVKVRETADISKVTIVASSAHDESVGDVDIMAGNSVSITAPSMTFNGASVATKGDIIPYTSYGCYSNEFTVADLISQLTNEGVTTISGQPIIVSFVGMVSGTFLCRFTNYHGDYYGCEFTDLKNIETYYFEGTTSSLSLYECLIAQNKQLSLQDVANNSPIIDLGEQDDHKLAQQAMVDYLTTSEYGCYLFKYDVPCRSDACLAIVRKYEENTYIEGTVYDSCRAYRYFYYSFEDGFVEDGCWKEFASFNAELGTLTTENKTIEGAINELNSKIGSVEGYLPLSGGTMTGELVVNGGDKAGCSKIVLETGKGQITNSGTSTLFGFGSSSILYAGHSSYSLLLRGAESRPKYNGNYMALQSDIKVPSCTTADNGKVLKVVNGVPTWVTP